MSARFSHPQRIIALMPLAEALALWLQDCEPVLPRSEDLAAATGAVLAEDLLFRAPLPVQAEAAVDGRAVRADQLYGASGESPVFLTVAPPPVDTGSPMPVGTDAVISEDAVGEPGGLVEITASAAPGAGVRAAGYDAEAGARLGCAGERLSPAMGAVARLAGLSSAHVRRPRVNLVVTGDSPDAVSPLLARSLDALGAGIIATLRVPADRNAIVRALTSPASDLIVTVGGTGVGGQDHSVAALADAGRLAAHGLAISPGESAALGTVDDTPVLMLPGRLDAALGAWLLAGIPALQRLAAGGSPAPDAPLPLARKIVSTIGMTELCFARRDQHTLMPLGGAGLPLSRLARADGYVVVPPQCEGWPEGASVSAERLWACLP